MLLLHMPKIYCNIYGLKKFLSRNFLSSPHLGDDGATVLECAGPGGALALGLAGHCDGSRLRQDAVTLCCAHRACRQQ